MTTGSGGTLTKRVLVDLSHAIEQFALAAEPGEPLAVIALFQKSSYFARERDVYGDIAQRANVTLVAVAEDSPPDVPPGVRPQLLARSDPLAREWSVTVLGAHGGASLVAIDQETVTGDAPTLEQGRQFTGRWSFRRDDAYREVVRLRSELRLPPAAVAELDTVLQSVVAEPEPPRQEWWDGPLRLLADRVENAVRSRDRTQAELAVARAGSNERDPRTGLLTTAYLERWTAGLGSGTLPIGLVALRVLDIAAVRESYGMRAEMASLAVLATVLQGLAGPADRVIRTGREDFLLVLPGRRDDDILALTREIAVRTTRIEEQYPFVTLETAVTGTVTRERPLPIGQLFRDLSRRGPVSLPAG